MFWKPLRSIGPLSLSSLFMYKQILESKRLSVLIPVYNELNIAKNIHVLIDEAEQHFHQYEIIIVSDGSNQETVKKLKKCKFNNVHVYHYPENKGKGFALKFAFSKSTGDFVVFLDGGMELHPSDIKRFFAMMEVYNADIIIGSKRHPLSNVDYPWYRRILSYGYQILLRALFKLKEVRDTQVGLKLFKRDVLEKVFPYVTVNGYAFDIAILVFANFFGFKRIMEAPVELCFQKGQKKHSLAREFRRLFKVARQMFFDTLKISFQLKAIRKGRIDKITASTKVQVPAGSTQIL